MLQTLETLQPCKNTRQNAHVSTKRNVRKRLNNINPWRAPMQLLRESILSGKKDSREPEHAPGQRRISFARSGFQQQQVANDCLVEGF